MEWLLLLEKGIWFGLAAIGFGVLFNVPKRTLLPIYIMAAIGGLFKVFLIHFEINVILSTFVGATAIGFLSIWFAHVRHAPPPVFAIPAVIPMVPGIFAYRMMLGLMHLSGKIDPNTFNHILSETVNNGLKVMFILMALAGGVGVPLLITRKESAKEIKIKRIGFPRA
ncbi:threonine/serine exporter family protein [Desertivirga brevis]|uniref:threonine/serine exporter family protein n=1 Tax=Desertivirga brevis TaxID=2810310 RepID=UPI001A9704A9|nr:threonine/serine exporter family protein [Pedobacter sp. SYSU D00873]